MTDEDRIDELEHRITEHLDKDRRKTGVMENHAQTIIVFVILAVLSWVGYSILETSKEFSVMSTSIAVMKTDMSHMKQTLDKAANNYVTKVEYSISTLKMGDDIDDLKKRVEKIEESLNHKHQK